ncbi:MAG: putative porin, partial [Bacteroidaceae bacterium]|nr:putative porin [Bacteroidaceae bacterium]
MKCREYYYDIKAHESRTYGLLCPKTLCVLCLFCVLCASSLKAQRIVRELEANTDNMMMPNDTIGLGDEDSDKKDGKKVVPNDIRAWVVDEIYGNMSEVPVDTLHHQYQNSQLPEGVNGHYNTLGNLGSPRMSRIYMERPDMMEFIFLTPMDQFFRTTEHFPFYNTKSPFMNIAYNFCGSKETGYDHVRTVYTNNANKRMNFGGMFDYMYGQGYYENQSTGLMNASAWASYLGSKYCFHTYYQHNFMKMAENGGISDETYITAPETHRSTTNASNDIPVYLNNTWNRQENDIFFYNHHYNLGYYKTEPGDTTGTHRTFVPVSKIFHTLKFGKYMRNYRQYSNPQDYYSYTYYPADTTEDRTRHMSIKNIVGLSLCEGFNKWAAFGINAYVGHEYRTFNMLDSLMVDGSDTFQKQDHKEHDLFLGGQLIRTQGEKFHFNLNARFVFAGTNVGDLEVDGHTEFNFPFLKDSAQVALNAFIKNISPSYYMNHYHSRYCWWDVDMSKEWKTRVEAVLTSKKTKTTLTAAIENVKNYTYFQENGLESTLTPGHYTHNVVPMQESNMIQIFSINLLQNFRLGILHLDNDITYQATTHK